MQAHELALKPHPVDLLVAPVSSDLLQDDTDVFAARWEPEIMEAGVSFVLGIKTADGCQEVTAQWRVNVRN